MNRTRVTSLHKIAPASVVAFLLLCTPLQLTAQEKEPRATDHQTSAVEWVSSLWNDLTGWLAGTTLPTPPPTPDDACSIDPWGRCPHGS